MLWLWEDIWRFGDVSAAIKYCNCDRLWSMYLSMSSGPPIPYGKGSSVWKAVMFEKFVFNVKAQFLMFSKTQFWRESFVYPMPKTMRLASLTCHTSDHCWRQRMHEHIAISVTVSMSDPPSVGNIRGQKIATQICKQNQDSASNASLGQKSLSQANPRLHQYNQTQGYQGVLSTKTSILGWLSNWLRGFSIIFSHTHKIFWW